VAASHTGKIIAVSVFLTVVVSYTKKFQFLQEMEKMAKKTESSKPVNESVIGKYFDVLESVIQELLGFRLACEYQNRLITLITTYVPMSSVSKRYLEVDGKLTESGSKFLVLWFFKGILDLETLRSLCLMPPAGVKFSQWRCLFGRGCGKSFWSEHDVEGIRILRKGARRQVDNNDLEDYLYEEEEQGEDGAAPTATTHAMYFPMKALHPSARRLILEKDPRLEPFIDNLFVCWSHFQPNLSFDGRKRFYGRTCNYYSVEFLNQCIESGETKFSLGRQSLERRDISRLVEIDFDFEEPRVPDDEIRREMIRRVTDMLDDSRRDELGQLIDTEPILVSCREQA